MPYQLLEVLILHHHILQPPAGLLDEGEIVPHIVGLAGEAGEAGGVALPDDLVEPCRPLDIRGALLPKGQPYMVEVRAGIQDVLQGGDEQVRLVPDAAEQVGQEDVEAVVHLKILPGRLMEQHPAPASEHFNKPLIVQWKPAQYCVPQKLLSSDPAHEAVQGGSPPPASSPKFSSDVSRLAMTSSSPAAMALRFRIVPYNSPAFLA